MPGLWMRKQRLRKGEIHFSKCILWLQVGEAGPESGQDLRTKLNHISKASLDLFKVSSFHQTEV